MPSPSESAVSAALPELIVSSKKRWRQVVMGSLASDLPDLLAQAIVRARPTWKVEVTASEDRCRSGGDASLVIAGAIRRTELREHMNFVPLGLLAVLGVPHRFVDFSDDLAVWVVFYGPDGGEARTSSPEAHA